MANSLWTRLARLIVLPLRKFITLTLSPVIESKEFKTLYPVLVVSLGLLAAFHTDRARTLVYIIVFSLIAIVSIITVVLDAQRIKLHSRWNLLFFSYYRPSLITLANKIARSLDGQQKIDILTYRTGDFLAALNEAAADFEQVSGNRVVNIASFDIEYVPLLKKGIKQNGIEYRLIPLSDFWTGSGMGELRSRMPRTIKRAVLQRLEAENLYALPIGWGYVGVGIFAKDLSGQEIAGLLTTQTGKQLGFDFGKLFENITQVQNLGYEVLCYDFWSNIGQLVSLNYTGHMGISATEEETISKVFGQIRTLLPEPNIISDPIVLLGRVKAVDKSLVIGASTWFGIKGTLLPIAIPEAPPVYGAFCECLGILMPPKDTLGEKWESDAATLMLWLANQLGDQRHTKKVVAERSSILQNYLPGLVGSVAASETAGEAVIDLGTDQQMQIDEAAETIFRQFGTEDIDQTTRVKELWSTSHGS